MKTNFISLLLILIAVDGFGQRRETTTREIQGHTEYHLLEPGTIPAIFDPQFIPISQADDYYFDNEPLMVVVDGDIARGYSTWHLDKHEIVNDYINGKAITVTW